MWLKQMVIDGFKSYAQRTVISDWDRHFTAITGLNGSGKSNILDAICFVLGITNLQQVRVTNLQQLVYKEGQARVTKASVTLVLDNTDKTQSPMGYEDYDEIMVTRQVVIGGRNKYLINGQSAQLNRVKDLFLSVQLDVNNPHFLIMQGRITKVLNMKPMEILGMIQEAAGTKMYEMKKKQAIKTMDKKQTKVKEINKILEEEITPQLDKLRAEKSHYLEWTQNNNEIERLERLMTAYKYMTNKEKIHENTVKYQQDKENIEDHESDIQQSKDQIEQVMNEIDVKQNERDKCEESGFKQLTTQLNDINKQLTQLEQQIKNKEVSIKREKNELKTLKTTLKSNENLLSEKEEESKQIEANFANVNQQREYLENRIKTLESSLLGINDEGDNNNNDDSGSLRQQLMSAKKEVTKIQSNLKKNENHSKRLQKEIKNAQNKARTCNERFEQMKRNKQDNEAQLQLLEQQLQELGYDEKKQDSLERELQRETEKINNLDNELRGLQQVFRRFDFNYDRPYPQFNTNWVFGRLARLFTVRDNKYAKSLEITAGGKLYNVVVTTNEVGKDLLDRGRLRSRVTIIPLNKIQGNVIDRRKIQRAKDLAGEENCHLALELVGYGEELDAAMKYVFGQTFICSDMSVAREVAFDRSIKTKTVTLDGEVFNPAGLLTGGSSNNDSNILAQMSDYNVKQTEFERINERIRDLRTQLNEIRGINQRSDNLRENIDNLRQSIIDLNDQMNDSAYQDIMNQIELKTNELNELGEAREELFKNLENERRKVSDLESDIEKFKDKETQEKEYKKEINKCKKELKNLSKSIQESNSHTDRISIEINECKEEIKNNEKLIEDETNVINKLNDEFKELSENRNEMQSRQKDISKQLQSERNKLSLQDKSIKKLMLRKKRLEKELKQCEIALEETKFEMKKRSDSIKHCENINTKLLNQHPWLSQESEDDLRKLYQSYARQHIHSNMEINDNNNNNNNEAGVGGMTQAAGNNLSQQVASNTIYQKLNARIIKLRSDQARLNKKINHKVMSMFERAENEYRDLTRKREIVRNDKKKIESVIAELDKKKEDTLETTFHKVNEHFENIFSKLLPGTHCKLCVTQDDNGNDKNILEGLEVKVAFGDVWKESLSELSGGQRSLLALSLILSLLLFKPAPLYILDEIDAALDLSHTQNIGILLSKYFNKSQFIVVSLKEGMFNNANVIFRTSFVDGVSAVKRAVGVGINKNNNNNNNNNNNSRGTGKENMRRNHGRRR